MASETDRIEKRLEDLQRKLELSRQINAGLREEIDRLDQALLAVTRQRDEALERAAVTR